jgi:hypothetical protein
MAISKILHMKQAKSGYPAKHLANGLKYIMDADKTMDGQYVSAGNCTPENALQQMLDTKRHFGKMDKRQGYHFIISFEEEELTEDIAFEIVGQFVKEFLGDDFEAVYAIHNDTDHIHGHIIFNSVRCTTGYKYDYRTGDWDKIIQPLVNRLCEEHGLSTLNMEEVKEKRRLVKSENPKIEEETAGEQKRKHSDRDKRILSDVDCAVQDADTYEEFLEILHHMGYETRGRKHLAVKETGAERARRLDTLGEEYTEEMLRCRIAQPPVLSAAKEKTVAEIRYVFVPYRNRHLTRYQKQCFIRKYRAGKIHADTKTWKYKSNLQALKRLQAEYLFWDKYKIHSKAQLDEIVSSIDSRMKAVRGKKKELYRKRAPYEAVLSLLKEAEYAEIEASLYLEGYQEYAGEYEQYREVEEQLSALGYSVSDARKTGEHFAAEKQKLEDERRELLKEKHIALRLKEKIYQKERNWERAQDEIEQKRQL